MINEGKETVSSFTFYTWEISNLIEHLYGAKAASFDIDKDGYVTIYVEGKEPITL